VRPIFAFHACSNSAAENQQYDSYHYNHNGGFLVVIPEAANGVCWRTDPNDVDMPFVAELIEQVEAWPFVDASERYVTGWSGGAFMSNAVACHLGVSELVAGAGGLRYIGEGNDLTELPSSCIPTGDMFLHHGIADTRVPISVGEEARDAWIETNSCHSPTPSNGIIDWCSRVPEECSCTAYTCAGGTLTWCEDGAGHQQSIHGAPQRDVGEIIFNN
jgi:poly(3-hydroxybutyrate) depolymerase